MKLVGLVVALSLLSPLGATAQLRPHSPWRDQEPRRQEQEIIDILKQQQHEQRMERLLQDQEHEDQKFEQKRRDFDRWLEEEK